MTNKNNLIEFDADILACKKKIKELEPYIEQNEAIAIQYNRLLVQKAILMDRRKKERYPQKKSVSEKLRKLFTFDRKKRLICDYFQESI